MRLRGVLVSQQSHQKLSLKVAADIDSEVKRIIDECYEKAKEIIVSKTSGLLK